MAKVETKCPGGIPHLIDEKAAYTCNFHGEKFKDGVWTSPKTVPPAVATPSGAAPTVTANQVAGSNKES